MSLTHQFFFGIYPYIAMVVFLLGSLARFDRDQYTWRSESSQMLATGTLRAGSNLFHLGIIGLFFGHFFGMLTPPEIIHALGVTASQKQMLAVVAGGTLGSIGLIGLLLLIALSAKNAILIIRVARQARLRAGATIVDAAIQGAQSRFRPILMTSFSFILGVAPLVVASGAGASARASIGITVFSGMLASTCLAVLFVPSFFVVIQGFEEWLAERRTRRAAATAPVE